MLSQFSNKLLGLGLDIEFCKDKIKSYSTSITLQDFDNDCLKFERFLKFCDYIEISPSQLFDNYYRFVSSNYGKALVQYRVENNLSQKQCAKILKISPVDIGLFENGLKYPTRKQYLKLRDELKYYVE